MVTVRQREKVPVSVYAATQNKQQAMAHNAVELDYRTQAEPWPVAHFRNLVQALTDVYFNPNASADFVNSWLSEPDNYRALASLCERDYQDYVLQLLNVLPPQQKALVINVICAEKGWS